TDMVTGVRKDFMLMLLRLRILFLAFAAIRNPVEVFRSIRHLGLMIKRYVGSQPLIKGFSASGRYFQFNNVPGFPSKAFDTFHREEFKLLQPSAPGTKTLRSVILALTNKCPLKCEHCYEIELLNRQERLSLDMLKAIVSELQRNGVTQIYLSGGEPLARFSDLLELLRTSRKGTDFWLVTSGTKLTMEKALQLKRTKRLTGVCVSLDHYLPQQHNAFRNRSYSYTDAVEAVQNSLKAGLATGMAICTTKSFVSWSNLMNYAELAKSLGAHFIQLQEPYPVGGFAGKGVMLSQEQTRLLEQFYKEMNCNKKFRNYPLVVLHSYHQRRIGCFGGSRYFYIDSDGNFHSCPYCRGRVGNIFEGSLEEYIRNMEPSCLSFSSAHFHHT
ncbi:MAG TPA: radical SAM protein, partial [Cyclobacteriaceae bacterium]